MSIHPIVRNRGFVLRSATRLGFSGVRVVLDGDQEDEPVLSAVTLLVRDSGSSPGAGSFLAKEVADALGLSVRVLVEDRLRSGLRSALDSRAEPL